MGEKNKEQSRQPDLRKKRNYKHTHDKGEIMNKAKEVKKIMRTTTGHEEKQSSDRPFPVNNLKPGHDRFENCFQTLDDR